MLHRFQYDDVLAYADGSNSLFDIANRISVPLDIVLEEAELMLEHGLITVSGTATERQSPKSGAFRDGDVFRHGLRKYRSRLASHGPA
jgi:hypothetical protein